MAEYNEKYFAGIDMEAFVSVLGANDPPPTPMPKDWAKNGLPNPESDRLGWEVLARVNAQRAQRKAAGEK